MKKNLKKFFQSKFFSKFFKRLKFFYFRKRKMEKNLYRGYILVHHKMGKTAIEIFEDLCLAYSDSALSYVTFYG